MAENLLLDRLFDASFHPLLADGIPEAEYMICKRIVTEKIQYLTSKVDRNADGRIILQQMENTIHDYIVPGMFSTFATDFAYYGSGACLVFANTIVAGLEMMGRYDILGSIKVRYNPVHIWLAYEDDAGYLEMNNSRGMVSTDHGIESLVAGNYGNTGAMLMLLKKYDDALSLCDKCLEMDGNQTGFRFNKAEILFHLNRTDEAMAEYKKCIDDPIIGKIAKKRMEKRWFDGDIAKIKFTDIG